MRLLSFQPSSEGGEGRPWSRGMTEDEDEMTPLRHMGYGKNRVGKLDTFEPFSLQHLKIK